MVTKIFALLLALVSTPLFAVTCYTQVSFYGCANPTGTYCTKVAVTALIPDPGTPAASCNYLTLSGSEFSTIANSINTVPTLTTRVTNVESGLNALYPRVSALETEVTKWDSAIAQNTQAVGTLNQVLNEPFDLQTGLAAFAFFFSTTLFFYGVARGAGAILETVRRPLGRG